MERIILHRIELLAVSSTLASDPPYYLRKDTWQNSAFRLSYPPWQRVFNVGFRVICEAKIKNPVAQ